jgi:hypothetical protein
MNQGQFGRTAQLLQTTALASGALGLPNRSQFFAAGWHNFTVPDGVNELWISGAAGGSGGHTSGTTTGPGDCIGGWLYQPSDRRWLVTASVNDSGSPTLAAILTLREDEYGEDTAVSMRHMVNEYGSSPGAYSRIVGGNADGSVIITPQATNGTDVWVSTDQGMNFVQRTVFSASRDLASIIGFAGLTTGQCWMAVAETNGTTRFAYTLDFGLTWTEYTVSTGTSGDVPSWFGIVNGIFVIGGYNSSTGGSWLQTSTTGLSASWSGRTPYGSGTSARFDGVYYSTNGRYTILTGGNATNTVWNGTSLASLTGVSTASTPQKGDINGNTIIFPLGNTANTIRSTDGGATWNTVATGSGANFTPFTQNGNDGRKQIVYIPAFGQWLIHTGGGSANSYANSYDRYSINDGSSWTGTSMSNAGGSTAGVITAVYGWLAATATSWVAFAPTASNSGIGVRARLPLGQATDLTNSAHYSRITTAAHVPALTVGGTTRVTRANGENLIRLIAATSANGASQFLPTPAPTTGLGGRGVLSAEGNGQEGNTASPRPQRAFGGAGAFSSPNGGGGGGGAPPFSTLPSEGLQFLIPGASAGLPEASGGGGAGGTIYAVPGSGATSTPSIIARTAQGYGGGSPNAASTAFGGSETCWRYRVPVTPGETLAIKVGIRGQGVSSTSREMSAIGSSVRALSGSGMVNLEWRAAA